MNELRSLSEIFNHKLLRIPDYQRGYAWLVDPHLTDFWEDLISLADEKKHYTGVLSLEEVKSNVFDTWIDDRWLAAKSYRPYYIVDGQQRITTAIILIQAIIEVVEEMQSKNNDVLISINYSEIDEIRKAYIFQIKNSEVKIRSYIFGYERDNPSNEFLRTRIFNELSSSDNRIETLYTLNLENAKKFFKDNLLAFPESEKLKRIEAIFKKLTTSLLFNEYIIDDEMDVFVAFETMNNRGKKLSNLELLKNRLIYLSTLYIISEDEQTILRNRINDCWKEIYFQLGRNKHKPLNDDEYLRAHKTIYFGFSTKVDYSKFLLKEFFLSKKVLEQVRIENKIAQIVEISDDEIMDEDENGEEVTSQPEKPLPHLPVEDIENYVVSLRSSARHWYNTFFPQENKDLTYEEQVWLNKLNRIGIGYFRPLILSAYMNQKISTGDRVLLFKNIERFVFVAFRLSQAKSNYGQNEFNNIAKSLYLGNIGIKEIITRIKNRMAFTFKDGVFNYYNFKNYLDNKFKYYGQDGFYGWSGLKYFLYEYETYLFESSMQNTEKIIDWSKFMNTKDTETIEHIYPQNPNDDCWKLDFEPYSDKRNFLVNSLGNLLALSQPKNSSLQNDCFEMKKQDRKGAHGYFNGSFSEIEVTQKYIKWTPQAIKHRGLSMLDFMEKRWNISLGDEKQKLELLHVDFVE